MREGRVDDCPCLIFQFAIVSIASGDIQAIDDLVVVDAVRTAAMAGVYWPRNMAP